MKRNIFIHLLSALPFIGTLPGITKEPIRVGYNEMIYISLTRIPFLKTFLYSDECQLFDSKKINEYMGYEYLTYQSPLTSESINAVLAEAQRRGDI